MTKIFDCKYQDETGVMGYILCEQCMEDFAEDLGEQISKDRSDGNEACEFCGACETDADDD